MLNKNYSTNKKTNDRERVILSCTLTYADIFQRRVEGGQRPWFATQRLLRIIDIQVTRRHLWCRIPKTPHSPGSSRGKGRAAWMEMVRTFAFATISLNERDRVTQATQRPKLHWNFRSRGGFMMKFPADVFVKNCRESLKQETGLEGVGEGRKDRMWRKRGKEGDGYGGGVCVRDRKLASPD